MLLHLLILMSLFVHLYENILQCLHTAILYMTLNGRQYIQKTNSFQYQYRKKLLLFMCSFANSLAQLMYNKSFLNHLDR